MEAVGDPIVEAGAVVDGTTAAIMTAAIMAAEAITITMAATITIMAAAIANKFLT